MSVSSQRKKDLVLEALLTGRTITAAAHSADVDRSTVHRWLKVDDDFRASWNRARSELHTSAQSRLLQLIEKALGVIEGALDQGDTRAAIAILRGMGQLPGKPPDIGSDDADRLRRSREADEKEEEYLASLRRAAYP